MSVFWQVLLALIVFFTLPVTIPLALVLAGVAICLGILAGIVGGSLYLLINWPIPILSVFGCVYLFFLFGSWLEKRDAVKSQAADEAKLPPPA